MEEALTTYAAVSIGQDRPFPRQRQSVPRHYVSDSAGPTDPDHISLLIIVDIVCKPLSSFKLHGLKVYLISPMQLRRAFFFFASSFTSVS